MAACSRREKSAESRFKDLKLKATEARLGQRSAELASRGRPRFQPRSARLPLETLPQTRVGGS